MLRSTVFAFMFLLLAGNVHADGFSTEYRFSAGLENYLYTIAWVTDTQYMVRDNPDIWQQMVAYINNETTHGDIHYVVHTGDIVQDVDSEAQWNNFVACWDLIAADKDLLAGNHDVDNEGTYLEYESRYPNRVYYSREKQGWQFVFLSWEAIENETVQEWLRSSVESNDSKTIVLTHGYMTETSLTDDGPSIYGVLSSFANRTFSVWCGHVICGMIYDRVDNNTVGILHDFQDHPNGGNGFMVLVDMYENGYYMRLFSPLLRHDGRGRGRTQELSVVFGYTAPPEDDGEPGGFTLHHGLLILILLSAAILVLVTATKKVNIRKNGST